MRVPLGWQKSRGTFHPLENENAISLQELASQSVNGAVLCSKRGDFECGEPFFRLRATASAVPFSPPSPLLRIKRVRISRARAGCEIREIRRFSGGQKWGLGGISHLATICSWPR